MSKRPSRLVASLVTAAVVAGSASLMTPAFASGPGQAAGARPAVAKTKKPHPPRFYVETNAGGGTTQVRATATGAVTDAVHCPWAGSEPDSMAAESNNRTFFVSCQKFANSKIVGSRIFRFRLTNAGKVSGYSAVRGGTFNGEFASGVATAPDGSLIAADVVPGTAGPVTGIVVIKTKPAGDGIFTAAW